MNMYPTCTCVWHIFCSALGWKWQLLIFECIFLSHTQVSFYVNLILFNKALLCSTARKNSLKSQTGLQLRFFLRWVNIPQTPFPIKIWAYIPDLRVDILSALYLNFFSIAGIWKKSIPPWDVYVLWGNRCLLTILEYLRSPRLGGRPSPSKGTAYMLTSCNLTLMPCSFPSLCICLIFNCFGGMLFLNFSTLSRSQNRQTITIKNVVGKKFTSLGSEI